MEKEQLINILSNFELKSIFKKVELTNFWIMLMEEFPEITLEARRVARIWKRGGGAFLKEWEKCERPGPEFSLFLNQLHTVCPKIETNFLWKLRNSNVFSAQIQVISKKK